MVQDRFPAVLGYYMVMAGEDSQMEDAFVALCDDYRARCLWFLRPDYKPVTNEDKLKVLVYIERHGDLNAFRRASPIRKWLSQNSKQAFVG